ncbi:hypothetical protein PR202_ga11132 [Eleusine coracana subsp. coracana]|uniref:MSP domain-containing protein n=1 Tax=Eleusine coracana subsp. coracana TaxID=191504 RepID=A0AAV5C8K7_ELECO|nr:hypothetical protein PR202_ga11132 [Eleusine coracana subsp. coracana]
MLGVEPLEIHLSFELNKQITCSFHLDNDTDDYFAFSISTHSLRTYNIHPSIGIVQPRSKCTVSIALQPQKKAPLEEHCKEDFILLSTRVDGGLKDNGITGDMFDEEPGRLVDRVNLMVVLDVPNRLLMHV